MIGLCVFLALVVVVSGYAALSLFSDFPERKAGWAFFALAVLALGLMVFVVLHGGPS